MWSQSLISATPVANRVLAVVKPTKGAPFVRLRGRNLAIPAFEDLFPMSHRLLC